MAKACAEAPKYRLGLTTTVRCIVHICCTVSILAVKLRQESNKQTRAIFQTRDTFNCMEIHSNLFFQAGSKEGFAYVDSESLWVCTTCTVYCICVCHKMMWMYQRVDVILVDVTSCFPGFTKDEWTCLWYMAHWWKRQDALHELKGLRSEADELRRQLRQLTDALDAQMGSGGEWMKHLWQPTET